MKKDYGIVAIKSCPSGNVLDHYDGKHIAAYDADATLPHHQWYRVPRDGGFVALQNVGTGKVLGHFDGKRIAANDGDIEHACHQWKEIDVGEGRLVLQNRATGALLRYNSEKSIATAHEGTSDLYNQWTFVSIQEAKPMISIQNASSGKKLDGRGPSDQDPWLSSADRNAVTDVYLQWIIEDLGNDSVSIKSMSSGKYLDGRDPEIFDPWLSSGSRDPRSDEYLQWKIAHAGDFRVCIRSVSSGQYLGGRDEHDTAVELVMDAHQVPEDKRLHWNIDFLHDEPAEHPAKFTAVYKFTRCECVSCVGIDRIDSLEAVGRRSYPNEPPHFPANLKVLNLYLCDAFLTTATGGLNTRSSLPQETVDQICSRLRIETMKNFDQLSIDHRLEFRVFARAQLEEAIDKLGRFVVSWNDSKRVQFTTGDVPGVAKIVAVEASAVNTYVSATLKTQRSSFAGGWCVFMDWLKAHHKQTIHSLFDFDGLLFDAVRERRVVNLHGACSGRCDFQVSHLVRLHNAPSQVSDVYAVRSPVANVSYEFQQMNAVTVQQMTGRSWNASCLAGGDGGEGGDSLGLGGQKSTTHDQTWEQINSVTFTPQSDRCEVDMVVSNKTHANLWVHAASAIFSFGIMAVANHDVHFFSELPIRLTFDVPLEYIVAAWVSNPVGDMLNQLMGDPVVNILCAGRGLHAVPSGSDGSAMLTDGRPTQSSLYDVGLFGAAFIIHERPGDGRFYLSIASPATDLRDPENTPFHAVGDALFSLHIGDASEIVKESAQVWVNVDCEGRLVLADTPEAFKLHRDSRRYKHWVLHAQSRNAFVVRRADGQFYASSTLATDGSELEFSRVLSARGRRN